MLVTSHLQLQQKLQTPTAFPLVHLPCYREGNASHLARQVASVCQPLLLLLARLWLQVCCVVIIWADYLHAPVPIQHVNLPQMKLIAAAANTASTTAVTGLRVVRSVYAAV
jgi:hypothetical protein